jgi:rubrerythrin
MKRVLDPIPELLEEAHMSTLLARQNAFATKPPEAHKCLDKTTRDNLLIAMHGEAFAYVKYLLFTEQARKNGNKKLADLFERIADVERFEHFADEAHLVGLVRGDVENLEDAVKGESYEIEHMYLEFAQKAKLAGDTAAASRFEEIRSDERGHRAAFAAELAKYPV